MTDEKKREGNRRRAAKLRKRRKTQGWSNLNIDVPPGCAQFNATIRAFALELYNDFKRRGVS